MILIDNQQALDEFCEFLSQEKIIAIDSEFERRNTYYARPSIFQIVSHNHAGVIDLLIPLDLTAITEILLNDQILKIFHSPREDFEIFYQLFKILPKNFFDTQIAAKLCEMGASLSYSSLCKEICGVEIDKKYQKANWLKRPIKPQMLEYAIKDALYLERIYQFLIKKLEEKNLLQSFNEQMETLVNLKNYKVNARDAWKKVSFIDRSVAFINKMQVIAAFREECASRIDVPRRHFLSDEELVKICKFLPTSEKLLTSLNISGRHFTNSKYKDKLFELCAGLKENI